MDQPQPPWYAATVSTAINLWQAFVVPTALAVYAVIKFRASRKDVAAQAATALRQQADQRETAEAEDLDRMRASMDARMSAWVERLERENEGLRRENTRLLGLVRTWFGKAHDCWHAWAQYLTVANMRLASAGLEPPPETMRPPSLSRNVDEP